MMIALNRSDEFRMHVKAALRIGISREEIKQVLMQAAIYCGLPAANSAFRVAADVFQEVDEEPALDPSPRKRRRVRRD
jgi:4-carboxymuconolactone decarboxylase